MDAVKDLADNSKTFVKDGQAVRSSVRPLSECSTWTRSADSRLTQFISRCTKPDKKGERLTRRSRQGPLPERLLAL